MKHPLDIEFAHNQIKILSYKKNDSSVLTMDENNMSLSLPSKAAYQNQVVQQINEKIQNYPAVR